MLIECPICHENRKMIGFPNHLKKHNTTLKDFLKNFDNRRWYEELREKASEMRKANSPYSKRFYEIRYPHLDENTREQMRNEALSKSLKNAIKTRETNDKKLRDIYGENYESEKKRLNLEKAKNDKEICILNKMYSQNITREEAEKQFRDSKIECFRRSATSKHYWLNRGYSEDEAIENAKNKQKEYSWRCKEYWIRLGYNENEAIEIISEKQKKLAENAKQTKAYWNNNVEYEKQRKLYAIKYNSLDVKLKELGYYDFDLTDEIFREIVDDDRKIEEFLCEYDFAKSSYKKDRRRYYRAVWFFTHLNKHMLDGIELRGYEYQIDHIFSIYEGFKQNISPEIIGNIVNLRMISRSENASKRDRCDITRDELLKKYSEFINENKN